jgi:DNA polymerase-1
MRTGSGQSTEAIYIFHNMVRKLKNDQKPDYIAAIFESTGPTFRDEAFEAYKANRTETPQDLLDQIPWIRKTLEAMRIPILEYPRFEADDVIGTLSRKAAEQGLDVAIVSSDKDMLQLVTKNIHMLNPMKDDMWYDEAATETFMGVKPSQVADLLALKGDSVDNIPGAPGIGDKGAKDLIQRFGSVEGTLEHAAEVERKMYRESLQNNRDQILLSKQLATIHCDVPVDLDLPALAAAEPDIDALRELYQKMDFMSLLRDLPASGKPLAERSYRELANEAEFETWLKEAPADAPLAITVRDTATEMMGETLHETMLGVAHSAGIACSISSRIIPKGARIIHDLKSLLHKFPDAKQIQHDVMIYGFLLSADPGGCDLVALSERHLGRALDESLPAQTDAVLELYLKMLPSLESQHLLELYNSIELPLIHVLTDMEREGIRIDPARLNEMSAKMEQEISAISAEIYELAGKTFNISSPQQLGKVFFEDLKLPAPVKYGKGKVMSTAADVLEGLAEEHAIARKVLDFRQLTKLKGTYVDALPALIDAKTGRVHTTFNQTGSATGRVSSSNPNLQNIPIRTELGRAIRAAFVPRPGWKLIVADYSQIELRLLAHMSKDAVLLDAFRKGEDIHTRTAAEVFGVPPLMITPDQRRNAKAVNFGIVYGQTAFGLAQNLGIDRKEADTYIKAYFERYSGVRKWLDRTIAEVRASGVSINLFGRRRPIPDMNSKNPNARGFAERTAVNTPLQGSAADLIKVAMIRIQEKLTGMQAKLLLQVHDELVLEAPPEEIEQVRAMVKHEMENVRKFEVPIVVDTGVGDNWRDAK